MILVPVKKVVHFDLLGNVLSITPVVKLNYINYGIKNESYMRIIIGP